MSDRLARSVLLAPAAVARAAAAATRDPEQRWMLAQPRSVRASYVHEVLERDRRDLRQEIWMLRQSDRVRESYVTAVLAPRLTPAGRADPGASEVAGRHEHGEGAP